MEEKKNKTERTRKIQVIEETDKNADVVGSDLGKSPDSPDGKREKDEQTTQAGQHTFSLHIDAPKAPHEVIATSEKNIKKREQIIERQKKTAYRPRKTNVRIWNILEWIATSALIFMVIFFSANYQAYYQLLASKLDRLRGIVNNNPYIQQILPTTTRVTQELLPLTATPDISKKQIPAISLKIAPPDERVIIPRINQNVPVVGVSSENLIKRDWNALEKDIQSALQDGVVHYPGTAQPGQNGNVVITGHSSYFAWDPGRFKDVFALLHQVEVGDEVIVYYNQKQYFYKVYDKKVVMPDQVDVLTQSGDNRLTLITCTPVGTNLKRLVVLANPD